MGWFPKQAPSTAFLCTLIGIFFGFLLMPWPLYRSPSDFDVCIDFVWIIGGAVVGGVIGAIVECIDRRIAYWLRDGSVRSVQPPREHDH